MSEADIRHMEPYDIDGVVDVHLRAFEGFFLTFLGPRFLRLLYGEILLAPGSVSYAAIRMRNVVGFVVGVANAGEFYRRFLRRRLCALVVISIAAAIRRPCIFVRLIRTLGYARSADGSAGEATLLSIAVAPGVSGRGVGQRLARAFLAEMRFKGVSSVGLTTDRDSNDHANRFYVGLGFQLRATRLRPGGRHMNEYVMQF